MGYRIELWLDDEDSVTELKLHSPRFRRRPEPVQVKCQDCELCADNHNLATD